MDIYDLQHGVRVGLDTDEAQFEKLSSDYDEVDHELLLENTIKDKIYWDARLRGIYRGTCIDRRSPSHERKPALLVGVGFEFHPSPDRRFKFAQVEIDFSSYDNSNNNNNRPADAGTGKRARPQIVSFGPKFVTGIASASTTSGSAGFTLKTLEPFSVAELNGSRSWENDATNCMRIEGTCRSQGTRLVWTLTENPTAGFGLRGLPGGFEVAFLVICEKATVMSVHVRNVKVGWGVFDKERYMSRKYWPVTSYARDFILDPDDGRHEAPPNGGSNRDLRGEDVVTIFEKNGRGLIPA
ncbi:hypothetical protein PV04_07753 [Phialophora macrospora]|uniref:Uncharacterized protein n=1 Tax=Phialophora macrospora TaxID=1851006 RepID=A0A0D2CJT7_9EURO|nr:hypothetical protein PV04_07753 [Phialophora macrospora]